jgi:hypothetical protein
LYVLVRCCENQCGGFIGYGLTGRSSTAGRNANFPSATTQPLLVLSLFIYHCQVSSLSHSPQTISPWENEHKRSELPENTVRDTVVRFVNCCAKSKSPSTAPTDASFAARTRSRELVWAFGNVDLAERLWPVARIHSALPRL